jgi:hypothetical protein
MLYCAPKRRAGIAWLTVLTSVWILSCAGCTDESNSGQGGGGDPLDRRVDRIMAAAFAADEPGAAVIYCTRATRY